MSAPPSPAIANILHVSDLHYSTSKAKDADLVLQALTSDLIRLNSTSGLAPDLVIFSGDLVQAGETPSEFNLANDQFVQPLLRTLSLSTEKFFIAPGNHDISRQQVRKDKVIQSGLHNQLSSRNATNEFIDLYINDIDLHYFARMQNFNEFSNQFSNTSLIRKTPFFTTYMVPLHEEFSV